MAGSYILLLLLFLFLPGRLANRMLPEPSTGECVECHGNLIKNSVVHPELESSCDICHTSTGEDHPKANVKGFSLTEQLPSLCFNCHSEFQSNIESNLTVHGAMNDSKTCVNCHNPHSSQQPGLLLDAAPELCLRCHNKTITTDSGRIENISQIISRAKSIHSPVESGDCVTCHNPHFSEYRSLLISNFPAEQYLKVTVDNFELCFMCHDTDLLEAQETESGTNFRNGKTNLHFLHMSGDKGRSCIMCHDAHGAIADRLMNNKIVFGSWEMKMDFELSENGGSCMTGCHTKKIYDRTLASEK